MGVEPQKGQASAGHGGAKNQQLTGAWDVGEKQVLGINRATRHVSKDPQRRTHHHDRHDGQAIESVSQIHGIARTHDHQVGEDDKTEHTQGVADLLEEGQQQAGLRRQADIKTRLNPIHEQLEHAQVRAF